MSGPVRRTIVSSSLPDDVWTPLNWTHTEPPDDRPTIVRPTIVRRPTVGPSSAVSGRRSSDGRPSDHRWLCQADDRPTADRRTIVGCVRLTIVRRPTVGRSSGSSRRQSARRRPAAVVSTTVRRSSCGLRPTAQSTMVSSGVWPTAVGRPLARRSSTMVAWTVGDDGRSDYRQTIVDPTIVRRSWADCPGRSSGGVGPTALDDRQTELG